MKIKKGLILGLGAFSSIGAIVPAFVAQVKNTNTKDTNNTTNDTNLVAFPKKLSDINRRDINTAFEIWDTDPDMLASQMPKPQDAVKNFFPLMGVAVHWVSWQVDDINGQINYEVTLSYQGQNCNLNGATWGFKHFNPFGNITSKDVVAAYPSLPKANANEFASDLTKTKPEDQTLTVGNVADVQVKWTKFEANDFTGVINWTVTLTKETAVTTVTGTIAGFKKCDNLSQINTDAIWTRIYDEDMGLTPNPNVYASSVKQPIGKKLVDKVYVKDGTIVPNITFTLTNAVPNDKDGNVAVTMLLEKEGQTRTVTFTVSGYKQAPDLALINTQDVNTVVNDYMDLKATPTMFPSQLNIPAIGTTVDYTFKLPNGTIDNHVNVTLEKATPNDQDGTIAWSVLLSQGTQRRVVTGVNTGFKSAPVNQTKEMTTVTNFNKAFMTNDVLTKDKTNFGTQFSKWFNDQAKSISWYMYARSWETSSFDETTGAITIANTLVNTKENTIQITYNKAYVAHVVFNMTNKSTKEMAVNGFYQTTITLSLSDLGNANAKLLAHNLGSINWS